VAAATTNHLVYTLGEQHPNFLFCTLLRGLPGERADSRMTDDVGVLMETVVNESGRDRIYETGD